MCMHIHLQTRMNHVNQGFPVCATRLVIAFISKMDDNTVEIVRHFCNTISTVINEHVSYCFLLSAPKLISTLHQDDGSKHMGSCILNSPVSLTMTR